MVQRVRWFAWSGVVAVAVLISAALWFMWSVGARPVEAAPPVTPYATNTLRPTFTATPVVTASLPVSLAQITTADKGKAVTVQATVVGVANFSQGFKFTLSDGTAQVVLLLWDDDWDHVRDSYHLNTGAVVRATGLVDLYNDQLEVIPDRGADVQVLKWAKRDVRQYDLGALNGNDHNAVVQVQGTIADIQPFADGAMMLITDRTGAQRVRLYDVVARRIPQRTKLWVGQQVSVVGRVWAKRRAGIEIVVALPQDVYVLDAPTKGTPVPTADAKAKSK